MWTKEHKHALTYEGAKVNGIMVMREPHNPFIYVNVCAVVCFGELEPSNALLAAAAASFQLSVKAEVERRSTCEEKKREANVIITETGNEDEKKKKMASWP